ncbi:DivIVA domain-containing protein [Micromonospora rifamycinica]|uniref:DivIVA domain-containing protein n=1 Tax=Micromonospora rifamycinica TaxID=291594 RepID=UPI0033E0D5EB
MHILLSLLRRLSGRRPRRGLSGFVPWRGLSGRGQQSRLSSRRPWRGLFGRDPRSRLSGRRPWRGREPGAQRGGSGRHWPERPPNSGWYRSQACRPLTAGEVRQRQFRLVKRGLDPVEVEAFLHRVAADLATARRDLALTREENQRIKHALRSWRTHFTSDVRW